MIRSLNLSLTSKCSASCIFCPKDRGACNEETFMSKDTLQIVLRQAIIYNQRHNKKIDQVIIGENGDAFLHAEIIAFLKAVRYYLPDVTVVLFTNFLSSTTEQWNTILNDKLVDKVVCNIDSIIPEQYKLAKNADFYKAWEQFTGFLMLRTALHKTREVTIEVNVIDPVMYKNVAATVLNQKMGMVAHSYTEGQDYTQLTINCIKFLINDKDVVQGIIPCLWAERDKFLEHKLKNESKQCPQINRVKTEAFLNPDGKWYACCLDSKNELVLGHIDSTSLSELDDCVARRSLIGQLEAASFDNMRSPCNTVDCCQHYKLGGNKNEKYNNDCS
ncbi:MAG: radical SAM/SPASM domain-containing protein [Candidatus Paceibacterota bacterium]